jgi:hypothetical protein
MWQQKQLIKGILALLLPLLLAALLVAGCRPIEANRAGQPQTAAASRPEVGDGSQEDVAKDQREGAGGEKSGEKGAGSGQSAFPTQTAPPVAWDVAPACQNNPQDRAAWQAEFGAYDATSATGAHLTTLLEQMHRYTRALPAYTTASISALLAADPADPATAQQQALAVLWLNLVDERLTRVTAISAPDADAPQSVGDLSDQLAAAAAPSPQLTDLLDLADAVNAGQQLGAQVCARLIYRTGAELHTAQWTQQGAVTTTQPLTAAPNGYTTFSPDYTRLVVQTPRGDTAGGPLYLYELATAQTTNLNEQSHLPNYSSIAALKVIGWHPNNNYLLLANEDDEITIWLDLEHATYTPLDLGVDTSQMAAPRAFTLAPDGSGFAFLTYDRTSQATNLFWYDVEESAARMVLTLAAPEGELEELQISPDGKQAVYVLHKGRRREGRSEELRLVDLDSGKSQVLLSGPLGPLQPVWSPDGEQIAFVRRNLEQPLKPGPQAAMPLGDIWTLTVASGAAQQLTFTQAITRPPVWSPAGAHLAFVTAGSELGLVGSRQPDVIWRLDTQLLQPQWTRLGFLP